MNRTCRRSALIVVTAVVLVVLGALPASAHVTVNPDSAPKGGFEKLTFRVPNEMDNANTVKIDVQIPTNPPIPSVSVQPKPGWTTEVKTTPLTTPITTDDGATVTAAVSEIIWSGGQIKPGEFDEFSISAGPLPDVDSMKFPTIQSYDNGQDVSWIQDTVAGQPEPDHPAPVLKLTAATDTGSASTQSSSTTSAGGPTVTGTTIVKKESNDTLAIAALIVGILGVVLAVVALLRRKEPTPKT